MTLLEEIKKQVSKENFDYDVERRTGPLADSFWKIVCERYARECVKASLEKAAENAKVEVNLTDRDKKTRQVIKEWGPIVSDSARMQSDAKVTVNKSSITSDSNIVLL